MIVAFKPYFDWSVLLCDDLSNVLTSCLNDVRMELAQIDHDDDDVDDVQRLLKLNPVNWENIHVLKKVYSKHRCIDTARFDSGIDGKIECESFQISISPVASAVDGSTVADHLGRRSTFRNFSENVCLTTISWNLQSNAFCVLLITTEHLIILPIRSYQRTLKSFDYRINDEYG